MKKIIIAAIVIATVAACNKKVDSVEPQMPDVIYLDVQGMDNNGSITQAPLVTVTLK